VFLRSFHSPHKCHQELSSHSECPLAHPLAHPPHPRLISFLLFLSPLWIAHPYDLQLTAQFFKLPLLDSAFLLVVYWSAYLTFFITIYPPLSLTSLTHHLLYEPFPVLIHVFFTFFLTALLMASILYTHHRMQFIVETRRCGVWAQLSTSSSSSQPPALPPSSSSSSKHTSSSASTVTQKLPPQWKAGHSYRYQDICSYEHSQYQLISPFSCCAVPPPLTSSSLSFKYQLYCIMNRESGPLSQSLILTFLIQSLAIIGCSVVVVGLMYPRQVSFLFFILFSLLTPSSLSLIPS
jgi:hypothetical protein